MKDEDNLRPFELATLSPQMTVSSTYLASLTMLGLTILTLLINPACSGPSPATNVPTPIPIHRQPTHTPASTPLPTATPTPASRPTDTPSPPYTATPEPTSTLPLSPTVTATPISKPPPVPWNPRMPVPTAPPAYNPIEECVVPVCAPAPMLIEPLGGTRFAYGGGPELKWSWTYCLPDGWKFAVRVSLVVPPSSIGYVDSPNLVSCHNGKTIARFPLGDLIKEPGIYYWNIAVVRSVGFGWERLSYESEVRSFEVLKPRDDGGSP